MSFDRNTKLIGLSLSYCVADIVNALVDYDQVVKIITGTAARDDQWDGLLDDYRRHEWDVLVKERAPEAVAIANRLKAEGKIEQPRLTTGKWPLWIKVRWVTSEEMIKWTNNGLSLSPEEYDALLKDEQK